MQTAGPRGIFIALRPGFAIAMILPIFSRCTDV
jgi:hypothetical protein